MKSFSLAIRNQFLLLAEALGAVMLFTVPFWLTAFSEIGTPLDATYLRHMYRSPMRFLHIDYIAALIFVLIVGFLLWVLIFRYYSNRPFFKRVAIAICLLAVGFCANAIRIFFVSWLDLVWLLDNLLASLFVVLIVGFIAWRWRQQIIGIIFFLARVGALLFLVAIINISVAVMKLQPDSLVSYTTPSTRLPTANSKAINRVVWIIFDMLDEEIAFADRPKNVEMPALDKFRAESIVATNAQRPGSQTMEAMTTLFTGKIVRRAIFTVQDDLRLSFRDGTTSLWTKMPGIFQKTKSQNISVALLAQSGHPYCRLFVSYLSTCTEFNKKWEPPNYTLLEGVKNVLRILFEHVPLVSRAIHNSKYSKNHNPLVDNYQQFKSEVNTVLADPAYELVIVHWNLPHWPFYFDKEKNNFVEPNPDNVDPFEGYLGNLELTDLTFASMRESLEKAKLWDSSAVIVSADHGYGGKLERDSIRKPKPIVPLMIKLPKAKGGHLISKRTTAVSSSKLVWKILMGSIKNSGDVERTIQSSE